MDNDDALLRDWLREHGLEKYFGRLREQEIDLAILPELTDADLIELALPLGPRRRLMRAVRELTVRGGPVPGSVGTPTDGSTTQPERRQLTVMFADLVGSTALSRTLDLEELSVLNRTYQLAATRAIEGLGGYVARYMGDGVLAYFGYPRGYEDAPERAVRAAVRLLRAVASIEGRVSLKVRIGIATGPVVVGDSIGEGASRESTAVGTTPNLAARLQEIAQPGSVVISEETRRLVQGRMELVPVEPARLKGFDGNVQAYRVRRVRRTSRFEAATRSSQLTQFVGRNRELEHLRDLWRGAKAGRGGWVLVTGEPGIGKSRLTAEFQERVAPELRNRILFYCSPYYQNTSFYPVRDQLSRGFRFQSGDTAEDKLGRIEQGLARLGLSPERITPVVAQLQSIPLGDRYPDFADGPEEQRRNLMATILEVTIAMSRRHSVLQVTEDVHWADPSTLELIVEGHRHFTQARVFQLITCRANEVPSALVDAGIPHVHLSSLDAVQSAVLAMRAAGEKGLDPELIERIVSAGGGVPLFLEETTRTVIERNDEDSLPGENTLDTPEGIPVPVTLHDSLTARLDALGDARDLVSVAAVIGRRFDARMLAEVAKRELARVERQLETAVEAGIFSRRELPTGLSFEFKHALVQNVAYESLLRGRRRELHLKLAEMLGGPRYADYPLEVVARHRSLAESWPAAVDTWQRAGKDAMDRLAHREAVACFEHALAALERLPASDEKRVIGIELRLRLRAGLFALGDLGRIYPFLDEAEAMAEELNDVRQVAEINVHRAWAAGFQGRGEQALAAGNRARTIAIELGDQRLRALANGAIGWTHVIAGSPRLGEAAFSEDLDFLIAEHPYERFGQTGIRSVFALANLVRAHEALGDFNAAFARGAHGLAIARTGGNAYDLGYVRWALGFAYLAIGDPDEAERLLQRVSEESRANEIGILIAWSQVGLGRIPFLRGDASASAEALQEVMPFIAEIRNEPIALSGALFLAEALLESGRYGEGLELIQPTVRRVREVGFHNRLAHSLRLQASFLLATGSPHLDAVAAAKEALGHAEGFGQRPEIAHLTHLQARLARASGDIATALSLEQQAVSEYAQMGMDFWMNRIGSFSGQPANG